MLKETAIVGNQTGIHARPAGVLAKTVGQFQSRIELVYNGKTIKAKSIMGILGAGIKGRAQVEIICEGQDEERAMQELKQLFARGFGFD